jgi:branched-chain amino acid transport system substrate-binding protein
LRTAISLCALIAVLSACGDKDPLSSASPHATQPAAKGLTASAYAVAGLAENPPAHVKIGVMFTAPTRSNTLKGAQLAASQLNRAGGVAGRPIAIIPRGNISSTEEAAEVAEELITRQGVAAIVGPNRSLYAVAAGAVAQAHGIPLVTTTATNPVVTAAGDYVFMAAFTDDFQGEVMARFAFKELGARTAAVLTRRESIYSEGLSQTFVDNFDALGGEVLHAQFYNVGETDFSEQLGPIAETAPDVFFLPGFSAEIPLVVQQAKALGIEGILLGGDSWDNAALISASGAILEGSFFSTFFSSGAPPGALSEDADQFIAAYTAIFRVEPDGGAALGYDAFRLVAEAMGRASELTPAAIRDQLAATRDYSGATFISGYDENRHTSKSAVINSIVDGKIRFHLLIEP